MCAPRFGSALFSIFLALVTISCPGAASGIDILLSPKPQSYATTCQSYGIALVAGTTSGSPISVSNTKELRDAELDFRKKIEEIAVAEASSEPDQVKKQEKASNLIYSHAIWARALTDISKGKLKLNIRYILEIEEFYQRVATLTGNSHAEMLPEALILPNTPVMTSVTSLGKDSYSNGHIVTLYGLGSASDKSSKRRSLLLLNPAVKVDSTESVVCEGTHPGDELYTAKVYVEDTYDLKRFAGGSKGGYLLMWISLVGEKGSVTATGLKRELFTSQFVKNAIENPQMAKSLTEKGVSDSSRL